MSNILDELVGDAVTLVESQLPAPAAVRRVLGALIRRVDTLEQHALGPAAKPVEQLQTAAVADIKQAVQTPAPEPEPAASSTPAVDLKTARIARLKAQIAELEKTP